MQKPENCIIYFFYSSHETIIVHSLYCYGNYNIFLLCHFFTTLLLYSISMKNYYLRNIYKKTA